MKKTLAWDRGGGSAAIASLPFVACAALASPPVAANEPPSTAELGEAIDAAVLRHGLGTFWGAVVVTRGAETVLARGYGLADESLTPITADSLFDIGSNAKAFTAISLLALEVDGVLSLDDPVSKFFPEAAAGAGSITLLDLMTHTSGLSDASALQQLDFPDREEAVRLASIAPKMNAPGERFAYCNAGYVVLGAVIEKATGRRLEAFIRERFFEPAGMESSGFLDGEGIDVERSTTRARPAGPTGRPRRVGILDDGWGWGLRGAGGILTTPNDLAAFHRALKSDLLLDRAATERLLESIRFGYGFGWYVEPTVRGTRRVQHGGATRGYRSQIALYPDEDVMIAVLTNTDWFPHVLEREIAATVWPEGPSIIDATMRLDHLVLDPYASAILDDDDAGWRLETGDGRVSLLFELRDSGSEFARITMSKSVAFGLASRIDSVVGTAPKTDEGRGMAVQLGMIAYTADEDGLIRLPESVEWIVMPEYRGSGVDGRPLVDSRTTMVLSDADNGFWPVILKMEPAGAAAFSKALRESIEGINPSR